MRIQCVMKANAVKIPSDECVGVILDFFFQ